MVKVLVAPPSSSNLSGGSNNYMAKIVVAPPSPSTLSDGTEDAFVEKEAFVSDCFVDNAASGYKCVVQTGCNKYTIPKCQRLG